jgi:hypothetical protein
VHGHGACLTSSCPLYSQNQAPCCEGENEQVVDYAISQGITLDEAKEYFGNLLIEGTEQKMTGGEELAAPSPIFSLGEHKP